MAAQGVAAFGVATLASASLLVADGQSALDLSRLLLASLVGVFAFSVARRHGGWRAPHPSPRTSDAPAGVLAQSLAQECGVSTTTGISRSVFLAYSL